MNKIIFCILSIVIIYALFKYSDKFNKNEKFDDLGCSSKEVTKWIPKKPDLENQLSICDSRREGSCHKY